MDETESKSARDRRSANRGTRDRRETDRLALNLSVEIKGETPEGEPYLETAEAVAASQNGALLKSKSALSVGSRITIHNSQNDEEGNFTVVWTAPLPLEGMWNIGVALQDGESPLWSPSSS